LAQEEAARQISCRILFRGRLQPMFAAAAVAGAAAGASAARRRQAERSLNELLRDPGPLWQTHAEMLQPVWLLFVYIHDVTLVPKFAETRLQIRARYGSRDHYMEKYSQKVKSTREPPRAEFEAMFLFPWKNDLAPCLAFDLRHLGFWDSTVSTAAINIPFGEGSPGAVEHDMLFFGKKGEDGFIGQLTLFLEVRGITRAQLELGMDGLGLSAMDAAWTPHARNPAFDAEFLGGAGPFVAGPPSGFPGAASQYRGPPMDGHFRGGPGAGPRGGGVPVVQGRAVSGPAAATGLGAQPEDTREESYWDEQGVLHHVIITRGPDGREERLEWSD